MLVFFFSDKKIIFSLNLEVLLQAFGGAKVSKVQVVLRDASH
jgi:hypothetical protein